MKLAGFFLLLAGWIIIVAALVILESKVSRSVFVLAGLLVELLGLALVGRRHCQIVGELE